MAFLRANLSDYGTASNLQFNEKVKELIKGGRRIYHFGFGQSPFPIPKCFVEGLQRHAHRHEYLPAAGVLALREKILSLHRQWDNFDHFHPNKMVLGAGSKEIIYLILAVFNGDVLLHSPCWTTYPSQAKLAGRPTHLIPTSVEQKYLIQPEILQSVLSNNCSPEDWKLLILNTPNNPAGTTYTEKELQTISQICRQNKVLVVSDEIYGRLHFTGNHKSIANFYPEGTIVTSGFSKWASTGGWRVGYGLFPEELSVLYNAVASAASHTYTCCPAPVQFALVDGLECSDQLEDYILGTRKILAGVGGVAHHRLSEAGALAPRPEAGYYFMPDFDCIRTGLGSQGIMDGRQLCEALLEQANVALMPCAPYFERPEGELTTRFCFVDFDGDKALKALEKLGLDSCEIDEEFVKKQCSPVFDGLQAISNWMIQYKDLAEL